MSEEKTTRKKTRTSAGIATDAYNRLQKLAAAEEAELKVSPDEIRAKYAAKRAEVIGKLDPTARELTERLLGVQLPATETAQDGDEA
jgi:hypothetical protein